MTNTDCPSTIRVSRDQRTLIGIQIQCVLQPGHTGDHIYDLWTDAPNTLGSRGAVRTITSPQI